MVKKRERKCCCCDGRREGVVCYFLMEREREKHVASYRSFALHFSFSVVLLFVFLSVCFRFLVGIDFHHHPTHISYVLPCFLPLTFHFFPFTQSCLPSPFLPPSPSLPFPLSSSFSQSSFPSLFPVTSFTTSWPASLLL